MTFLVLLLTVGAYKLLGWHFRPEQDRWFFSLCERLNQSFLNIPRLTMLLSLLIPLVLVSLVLEITEDWLFGFAGLVLQVLILSYALGRVNLPQEVKSYLGHWKEGDYQSAYHHAQEHLYLEEGFDANSRGELHKRACCGVLYQWFEQVFVIIFWYLLLGPVAALFMRLLSLYERHIDQKETSSLLHILEWLPVRLLAFTYAIAGNFTLCFKTWASVIADPKASTEQVLFKCGLAAIAINEQQLVDAEAKTQGEQLKTLQALQIRCLVVCLILVALFVIF